MSRKLSPDSFSRIISGIVVLIGCIVMTGWIFNIPILKSGLPGFVSMKVNTALSLILSGISFIILSLDPARFSHQNHLRMIPKWIAGLVALIGFITLVEYISGRDYRIDEALFRDIDELIGTSHPGRMAPITAFNFIVMSGALLWMRGRFTKKYDYQILGFLGNFLLVTGFFELVSYPIHITVPTGWWKFTHIAWHTSVCFILLGVAVTNYAWHHSGLTWSLDRKISLGFSAGLLIMIFVSLYSFGATTNLVETASWVTRTQKVLKEIRIVTSDVLDVQSGQRGFLISGKDIYLDQYNSGAIKLYQDLADLRKSLQGSSRRQHQLDRLDSLFQERVSLANEIISLRKQKGMEAAIQLFLVGKGREIMAEIREKMEEIENEEYQLLDLRIQEANMVSQRTFLVLPIGTFASLIILISIFLFLNQEVTERVQAEKKLGDSENRYRTTLDHMLEGCQIIGYDWRYLYINEVAAKQAGRTKEELLGHTMMEMYPGIENTQMFIDLRHCMEERTPHRMENEFSFPDLTKRWFHLSMEPVPEGTFILSVDITKEKQLDEELKKHRDHLEELVKERTTQLEAVNKELETFSYSVSHDLRSPLRSMDGFSQALLEDYSEKLDDQGKDYLQRVRKASQRMAELIDDLLNLSQVTRAEIHREEVDISELVSALALELQKTQLDRQVELVIGSGLTVNTDPRLIRIAMENLLANAWKFTEKKSSAKIEFGVIDSNGEKVFFVRDNGAGFDMTYVDRLFGAFQRLHSTEEFPGTGIGLATVQRIVHRHGGKVWAEGEVGKGATFYFTI